MAEPIRAEWLDAIREQCADHPGTIHILGVDIDMDNLDEVRLALLWVSTMTSHVMNNQQTQIAWLQADLASRGQPLPPTTP